jgi:flagellar biosynthesis GTPase FlhF
MATESNVQSSEGVRTYRGRTLEEILPQIREELGPDAIILREREGLVGGVGGFFAQRFIEVEARRGDGLELEPERSSGSSIDIYDEDDELGFVPPAPDFAAEQPLLGAGDAGADAFDEPLDFSASRQTPVEEPTRSEPKPFMPEELQRERIIPRDPQGEPPAPTRRFETDVFLERLREASQVLPEDDEAFDELSAAAPLSPPSTPPATPGLGVSSVPGPDELTDGDEAELEPEPKRRRPARGSAAERKPRATQPRKPRAAPRGKAAAKAEPEAPAPEPSAPARLAVDPWTTAMAALVAEPEPTTPPRPSAMRPPARPATPSTRNPYDELRQRPSSLRSGLPTEPKSAPPATPAPSLRPVVPIPVPAPISPLEVRGRREGGLRSVISRLLGGRFGPTTLPRPSTPRPIDAAAASAVAAELTVRGASQSWTGQLIGTAAAHGTALSGGLVSAAEAELARRIVPAPSLPPTGAAVAFIGAGGTGKTRCTAALASAYSRASTLGVVVIAVDNPGGARELKRLLEADGVPVLSLSGERAQQAVAAYREGGFVIVDTPTTTPTDAAALEALGASLAPLELDATFVTLPATLGPQAARRALASFGRLDPTAVAITHADETDQLAVVVEIAIANRIPLAYFHAGTDHRSAMSAVDASALARQLLAS